MKAAKSLNPAKAGNLAIGGLAHGGTKAIGIAHGGSKAIGGLAKGTANSAMEAIEHNKQMQKIHKASDDFRDLTTRSPQAQGAKRKLISCSVWLCQKVAGSPYFSALTTLLTFYALFGDDMRLMFTDKPADIIFDGLTAATMLVFCVEIVVCSVGKAGYLFGFFFFLDILSTVTLILDITFVAEACFGDSVSSGADAQESSGGGATGGNSAEAARAARMSRAGTKAGRVVRLIRLMRLIRLIKLFKKPKPGSDQPDMGPGPGDDWEDEEDGMEANVSESAVSKKLSEMTTRRVIMLVLSILLALPCFQADMYADILPTSAQYGLDGLYRRFRDDMVKFDPTAGQIQRRKYMESLDRENYVHDFFLYIYFHNWYCSDIPSDKDAGPLTSFGKLFWVGGGPSDSTEADFFLPGTGDNSTADYNKPWNGDKWALYMCNLPPAAQAKLRLPWNSTESTCLSGKVRGVSLIEPEDTRVKCPRDLRFQERIIVSPMVMSKAESKKFVFLFAFDRRSGSQLEAGLNSGQTIFICLLLGIGAMTFSSDANKLVLAPIERMITKLDKIRANPIAAMTMGEEEADKENFERARSSGEPLEDFDPTAVPIATRWTRFRKIWDMLMCRSSKHHEAPEPMETVVLEKTIIKIGSLLALGFGEAGAEIIGQNMRSGLSDSAALNAMIPGKKVDAIFGYCDIRNFSDATEALEDQIMVFVNRIASVVHSCVNDFFGSPNQNVGDAFLLVWRLSGNSEVKQQKLADCATVSFAKIIALVAKSPLLAEYRSHPKISLKLPDYRVRMGFGLHTGWAIEGAIGSEFKIDASYLSPNVNMSATLQGFTKVYGSPVLLSDALINLMTTPVSSLCRLIDHVCLPDSPPFKLYTLDLDDLALEVETEKSQARSKTLKYKARVLRQREKAERWADEFNMAAFIAKDKDISLMRKKFTKTFFSTFQEAFLNYESGDWPVAVSMLEDMRSRLTAANIAEDGPSGALLRFMNKFGNEAPPDWHGYRDHMD